VVFTMRIAESGKRAIEQEAEIRGMPVMDYARLVMQRGHQELQRERLEQERANARVRPVPKKRRP
jgi:predicted DNA binding CopG/RHH family protein